MMAQVQRLEPAIGVDQPYRQRDEQFVEMRITGGVAVRGFVHQ